MLIWGCSQREGEFLKSFAIKLLFHNNDIGPQRRLESVRLVKNSFFVPPNYSKADWQQKKTDTWLLSSESRHERVAAGLLEFVAAGGEAVVVSVVVVAVEAEAAAAAAAAAAFDDAGLTLIVPVLDAELKWCVGVSAAVLAEIAVPVVVPDSALGDKLLVPAADVVAVAGAGP